MVGEHARVVLYTKDIHYLFSDTMMVAMGQYIYMAVIQTLTSEVVVSGVVSRDKTALELC